MSGGTSRRGLLIAAPALAIAGASGRAEASTPVAEVFATWRANWVEFLHADADDIASAVLERCEDLERQVVALPTLEPRDLAMKIIAWTRYDDFELSEELFAELLTVAGDVKPDEPVRPALKEVAPSPPPPPPAPRGEPTMLSRTMRCMIYESMLWYSMVSDGGDPEEARQDLADAFSDLRSFTAASDEEEAKRSRFYAFRRERAHLVLAET